MVLSYGELSQFWSYFNMCLCWFLQASYSLVGLVIKAGSHQVSFLLQGFSKVTTSAQHSLAPLNTHSLKFKA